jgi:AAA+ ATPase superfamily predicted ATPase
MFVGREEELDNLNKRYELGNFQCIIIYGRRRVGKTTLIAEFSRDKRHIFYVAQENSKEASLLDFSKKVLQNLELSEYQSNFDNWSKAFSFIGKQAIDEPLILVMDEFPYLARSDKSIVSALQNAIDHQLKNTKLYIIICGSHVSFMEKEILGYNSPIYGRRTSQMKIEPFSFFESKEFFRNYNIQQKIEAYCILGGVPLYLCQFNDNINIKENIIKNVLKKYSYLYEEPRNLLKQELREPMNYNAIIEAIADGATSINTIANKSKVPNEQCSKYLKTLIELLIVKKEIPLGESPTSRKSIYSLSDSFFKFWYRFIFQNISELELGMIEEVYEDDIEPYLSSFYGHIFEKICHQHFILENKKKKLPYRFSKIGKWWGNNPKEKRQEEIDLYAIGKQGIYLGECKWRNEKLDISVLKALYKKSELFHGKKTLVLYSKSGFTNAIHK